MPLYAPNNDWGIGHQPAIYFDFNDKSQDHGHNITHVADVAGVAHLFCERVVKELRMIHRARWSKKTEGWDSTDEVDKEKAARQGN